MAWPHRMPAILTMLPLFLSTGASVPAAEKYFREEASADRGARRIYPYQEEGRYIIGFSADGRYFAFQERGAHPGTGKFYREISVVDTDKAGLVGGAPFGSIANRQSGDSLAFTLKIRKRGDRLAGKSGPGMPNVVLSDNIAYPKHVTVGMPRGDRSGVSSLTFQLSEKPMASEACGQHPAEPLNGFTLTMTKNPLVREVGEGPSPRQAVTLHDDQSLPAGRGCVAEYGFSDVLRYESEGSVVYVILLQTRRAGSRGPHRLLAVSHICRAADCGLAESR